MSFSYLEILGIQLSDENNANASMNHKEFVNGLRHYSLTQYLEKFVFIAKTCDYRRTLPVVILIFSKKAYDKSLPD